MCTAWRRRGGSATTQKPPRTPRVCAGGRHHHFILHVTAIKAKRNLMVSSSPHQKTGSPAGGPAKTPPFSEHVTASSLPRAPRRRARPPTAMMSSYMWNFFLANSVCSSFLTQFPRCARLRHFLSCPALPSLHLDNRQSTRSPMAILSWCSRRVGGLSLLALTFLCFWVLLSEFRSTRRDPTDSAAAAGHPFNRKDPRRASRTRALSPVVFAYYSLFIHVLVTIFPVRACWGIWDVTRSLKKAAAAATKLRPAKTERKLSSSSLSSAETLAPSSSSSTLGDTEDLDSGYYADVEPDLRRPIHAVLIPNYKEDIDVLRETLDVLASHPQARCQYDVS